MLNEPRYRGAEILLARRNFGCGSSREHAPWALQDYGFRAVIAPSYGDIFFNNCYKNGLLPIVLSMHEVDRLFHETVAFPGFKLAIDLEQQTVATSDGAMVFGFEVEPFRKHCLLNGLDDIGLTLQHADAIRAFYSKNVDNDRAPEKGLPPITGSDQYPAGVLPSASPAPHASGSSSSAPAP